MFAIYAFCREVDDIADEPGRSAAGTARGAGRLAGRSARALRRATAPRTRALPGRSGRGLRPRGSRLPRRHRRHGHGRRRRRSARRTSRPSTSTATGSPARWAGCRCGSSAWRRRPAGPSPTISAAPCSSPTSCATSTRTPAMGRLYLPAEALAAAGIESRDPMTVVSDPRIDAACRWVAGRAQAHYREAEALMQRGTRGRLQRAAPDGRRSTARSCGRWSASGGRRRAPGSAWARRIWSGSPSDMDFRVEPSLGCRGRPLGPRLRGRPGGQGRALHRAGGFRPGRRAVPVLP